MRNNAKDWRADMFKIGFIGGGKMAEGILSAMADTESVLVAEKVSERAKELVRRYGVEATDSAAAVAAEAKTIFLAVRPQDVDAVAADVKPLLAASQVLVSIVAGKTLSKLRKAFGAKVRLVRVMPNLALRAKAGMCAVCPAANAKPADVKLVRSLLGAAGETVVLKERDFDAVTALSTEPIPVVGLTETETRTVSLVLPEGVTVTNKMVVVHLIIKKQ